MGIVNVTPDSFSDGGRYLDPGVAIEHGEELISLGADVVDVGGESTRPGAQPVTADEELRRVIPVVSGLAALPSVVVSIDTTKAAVAASALDVELRSLTTSRPDASIPRFFRSWQMQGQGT